MTSAPRPVRTCMMSIFFSGPRFFLPINVTTSSSTARVALVHRLTCALPVILHVLTGKLELREGTKIVGYCVATRYIQDNLL